jgi:hypothetical protein
MPDRRFIAIAVPALLFIVAAIVAVAVLAKGTHEPLGPTIAAGTLAALVATMIVSAIRTVAAVRVQPSPNEWQLAGITGLSPKHAITANEWLKLLKHATTEFYVAGHSLGRWCSASNREEFKHQVKRIVDGGGQVTLLMLDPSSPQIDRLQQATSVDYTSRIHTSLGVLAELCAELQPPSRDRLRISVLKDPLTLPYMVVGNEQRLVTATYLGSSDSDDVACLQLDRSSDAATAVYDDFHKLAEAGVTPTLPPVTIQASPPQNLRRRSWRSLLGR